LFCWFVNRPLLLITHYGHSISGTNHAYTKKVQSYSEDHSPTTHAITPTYSQIPTTLKAPQNTPCGVCLLRYNALQYLNIFSFRFTSNQLSPPVHGIQKLTDRQTPVLHPPPLATFSSSRTKASLYRVVKNTPSHLDVAPATSFNLPIQLHRLKDHTNTPTRTQHQMATNPGTTITNHPPPPTTPNTKPTVQPRDTHQPTTPPPKPPLRPVSGLKVTVVNTPEVRPQKHDCFIFTKDMK